jgi:citrate synthase
MSDQFSASNPLSSHDEESISVREKNLSSEIMGEMDFGGSIYYLLTGEDPTAEEQRLASAMLSSLMVHGTTPHAIASRLTYLSEPESIQGAVSSGLLGVGSRFAGAMEQSARDLQAITERDDLEEAVAELVVEYGESDDRFSGIGHPHLSPVDPRAERLFELAEEADVAGEHVEAIHAVQVAFEEDTGYELPINITGAIAAVASDMGLPPEGARGIAIISRAAGLVAEVLEERKNPAAMDIYQFIDERMSYEDNE